MMLLRALRHPPPIVLLIVLPALIPLARGLPAGDDALIHLYRVVELDWHLRQGSMYPRVVADLVYGYSYPLFNFYPALVYYLAEAIHLLGLDFAPALLVVMGLALYLPALGAYTLLADMFDAPAGYAAAAGLTYAPYTFHNLLHRTALPEAWALGLAAWLLWAYRRLALNPDRRRFVTATLLAAALLFSHNLTALLLTPFVWLWTVLHAVAVVSCQSPVASHQSPVVSRWSPLVLDRRSLAIGHWSLLLALALSAFFWLPAIAESRWVHIDRAYMSPGLVYSENFIPLGEALALPRTFDPGLILPHVPKSLGWPQLVLAGLALPLMLLSRPASPSHPLTPSPSPLIILFVAGLLLTALMTNAVSLPLWRALPFLRLTQFPWRFLGQATLFGGLLSGAAVGLIGQAAGSRISTGLAAAVLAATALYAFPWTFAPTSPPIADQGPTIRDVQAYEATYALGTNTAAEYLPIWVRELPDPESLAARYAAAPVIERLDRAWLPSGVTVLWSKSRLLSAEASLASPQPFAAVFDWFYFPGWRAWVDGRPAPIAITQPHGLISVRAPAGTHVISVRFGESTVRALADALSFAGLAALAATIHVWKRPAASGSAAH